jgi:hypothetical protein
VRRSRLLRELVFILFTAIAVARIANTWRHTAQTSDESPNIACGMQWLDLGRYDYGPFHPPLARAAIAASLYVHGYRAQELADRWNEGNAILHSRSEYSKALKWARAGVLPFFVLACVWVWLWSKRLIPGWGALVPVLLFTNTPAVLAHASVATTDMAVAAGVCGALFAFTLFLERPRAITALLVGLTLAAAFLSKFSALLFVPVGCFAIALLCRPHIRTVFKSGTIAVITTALLVWAAYGFSIGRTTAHLSEDAAGQPGVISRIPASVLHAVESTPFPAPQIIDGVWSVHNHNEAGHAAYLLGQNSLHGWWYFFPVALLVKTPLALLLLAAVGAAMLALRRGDWRQWAPIASAAAILLACLPANLNIGVRYVLPLYPMLAIAAGIGCVSLWESARARTAARVACVGLVTWTIVSAAAAHPDYISYFNELGGSHPEDILVDSDLDWGQDLHRLSAELKRLNVTQIHMDCLYTGDGRELDLPAWDGLQPYKPEIGWVAVSFTPLKSHAWVTAQHAGREDSPYAWLNTYKPYARVGRSILLYYIPGNCKNCNTTQ